MWSLLLTGMVVVAQAQSEGERLTPHKVASLRTVESAVMSPDGSQIAYTLSVPRTPFKDEDGNNWVELHLVAPAGGPARPFVTGEVNVSGVKWTPDGKGITFIAKRGKDEFSSLYVIAADGGDHASCSRSRAT